MDSEQREGASGGGPPPIEAIAGVLADAIVVVDEMACLVWGNPAAERLFGRSLEDAIGDSGLDLIHPEDLQLAAVSLASVQGKEVGTPLELRVRSADGWRLVEMIGVPLDNHIVLSLRDLTERRRWEIAGDEVARFRSLMQNAASITMLLDRSGQVVASSGALTRILGQDQEVAEGQHFGWLVDELDHAELAEALDAVCERGDAAAGEPLTVELRLRHARGLAVPFALTFTNLLDDPTVQGVVVTGHDISDRVRTEQAVLEANSLLAATLESTADGILVVDLAGRVTSCNGKFFEMWRLPLDTAGHLEDERLLVDVVDQLEDPAAFLAKVSELYAEPEAHSHDLLVLRDGRVFERDSRPQRIDGEVVGRVWSFRDVTEHRRLQRELVHQAFHDPLTGLANQVLFRDRTTNAAARLERSEGRLAILFIDLDDFKTVNDSLGHSAGDQLLVAVSERLLGCVRPGDTVARLGGDEFAILIDELDHPDEGVRIAERVVEVLREPMQLSGRSVSVAASVGVTYGVPGVGADELLRNADLAMYTAKSAGKSCYRVFAEEMHLAAVERLDLETHLRGAAAREELVLQYQPIFELSTGRVAAMEALVRWNHPQRGLLGPLSFIPFAEQGGLISEIGSHVLERACEAACDWGRSVGAEAPAISVNLSARQLLDPALPERVAVLLARCGLPSSQLILEITESALMIDPVSAVDSLNQLARLGVRLAVDDFGTGYSSLAYLQQFPVHLLKIDGSFVDDSLPGGGWSLAQAIVQIAHALGMVPIAEGIESQVQADALVAFGCELGQGFHLGRPLDEDAAGELVIARSASCGPGQPLAPASWA